MWCNSSPKSHSPRNCGAKDIHLEKNVPILQETGSTTSPLIPLVIRIVFHTKGIVQRHMYVQHCIFSFCMSDKTFEQIVLNIFAYEVEKF